MSDTPNFIAIPDQALTFAERARISLTTSLRFMQDQAIPSLLFLAVYLGFMLWDYSAPRAVTDAAAPAWLDHLPPVLDSIKNQWNHQSQLTWRASLASFIMLLYWGNALLYIADRSAAFQERTVVGLVRYLLRGSAIFLVMAVPVVIGLLLLLVPGIFLFTVMITAASLCFFKDLSVFRAIGQSFRLIWRGISSQKRVFGLSQVFIDIIAINALILISTLLIGGVINFFASTLSAFVPAKTLLFGHAALVMSSIIGAFLNLSLTIFILRTYAESIHVQETLSVAASLGYNTEK